MPAVEAVAVSAGALDPSRAERARRIELAMAGAVAEMYAAGMADPELVRTRMMAARNRAMEIE